MAPIILDENDLLIAYKAVKHVMEVSGEGPLDHQGFPRWQQDRTFNKLRLASSPPRREERWPPPGTDIGMRWPWLSRFNSATWTEGARYIKAVLSGDDLVEPDAKTAEVALSLVVGMLAAYEPRFDLNLDEFMEIMTALA